MSNKVRYGLKKAYYAVVSFDSDGAPVFGTPKKLPGAVNLKLDSNAEQEVFYADDIAYYIASANNGYDGTLELALIPDSFDQDCLGSQVDDDGLLVETASDQGNYFALLFEFTGDAKAIRHCLYYCKAARGSIEGETKGEKPEVKTEELTFTSSPLPDSEIIKAKTSDSTDSTRYDSWYSSVQLPDFSGSE